VRLLHALAALGEEDREAFVVAEIVGLSYTEVAEVCAATTAAVRSRIYRARMALRSALDGAAERRGAHG
jgi:RNA polymerase sigma-70 factor (ECF subfamily)